MIDVLIALEEPLLQMGARAALEGAGDCRIVGTVSSGEEAEEAARSLGPDVVLMDVQFQKADRDLIPRMVARDSELKVLVLVEHSDEECSVRALLADPKAADSLGVSVSTRRYLTAIVGGMLMAVAGAYLPMAYTGTFTEGMVHGRGWIAIALTFFGGWTPHLILFGAFFFAGVEVLALKFQVGGFGVPYQFLLMLPYIATIIVMMFAFRLVRAPAFLGQNYDREKRSL